MIRRRLACPLGCLAVCLLAIAIAAAQELPTTTAVSTTVGTSVPPIGAPIGAVVLFDGENTDAWTTRDGKPCPWKVLEDDSMEAGGGDIITKEKFEDVQLHVEFWLPKHPPEVTGQARGNSGVYLQARYEIQVLDSYGLPPDKHGCGAIYGRKKPKENACTPPETWQTYDITYKAAEFDENGKKTTDARVTVIHNGVTIHEDAKIEGPTRAGQQEETPGPAPIMLQDHGNPVRFRNIYAVPIRPAAERAVPTTQPAGVKPAP